MNDRMSHLEFSSIIYLLVRSAFIGVTIISILYTSHQDSYLSVILGFIAGLVPLYIYYRFIKSGKNILNIFNSFINNIIKLILFLVVLLYASLIFWNLVNFISSQYLYNTPRFVLGIAFMIPIIYINTKKVTTIGRVSLLFVYISSFLFLFSFLGLIFQIDITNVKPFLTSGVGNMFKSTLVVISYSVSPILLLSSIPKENLPEKIEFKKMLIPYIISFITIFACLLIIIGIYGYRMAILLDYPAFQVLKRISVVSFMERMEHFLFVQWIFDIFIGISLSVNFMVSCFDKFKKKYVLPIVSILLFFCSVNMFQNRSVAFKFIASYIPITFLVFMILLPIFIFIIKKRRLTSL